MKRSLLIFLLPVFCFATSEVAILKSMQGNIKVKRQNKFLKANNGFKLNEKDIVTTGKDSSAGIIFNDGSTLTLGQNSFVIIKNFVFRPVENKFKFNLKLEKGRGIFSSGRIGKLSPESFKMEVPRGIIGIRGTRFIVEVSE